MTEQKENKPGEIKTDDIKAAAEEKGCPVQKAKYYVTEFLAGPMCGKCLPCALGSYEAGVRLDSILEGRGTDSDVAALRRIADDMLESSRCKKGKDTAKFILEWMSTGVYEEHVRGRCPDGKCKAFVEYRIVPEKCTMCGLCREACRYEAVIGEKRKPWLSGYRPFEIRQKKCTKCDECRKVCPTGAVVIVDVKREEPVGV
jgi:ferredoxin